MKDYALFLGCQIQARLNQYESSARAVLNTLDVRLVDVKEFNCCGYPLRNIGLEAFLVSSARNLALAEKRGLDILALCKCCFGTLKNAAYILREFPSKRREVSKALEKEGLEYEGTIEVKHLLSVLFKEVGVERIKERMTKNFSGLKVATHYGCHALRPSKVTSFDDPLSPSLFDKLVEATGAESIEWQMKLECCGAPVYGVNDGLSADLMFKKLLNAKESGAQFITVGCPYCHIQFDTIQKMMSPERTFNHPVPSILFTQLLGLCLGVDKKVLGLELNEISLAGIETLLHDKTSGDKGENG